MIQLRGGFKTTDRRLDRLVQFDDKSRNFPIRSLLQNKKPRSFSWNGEFGLDQQKEGACVMFAWAHEARAHPSRVQGLTEQWAKYRYWDAQRIDPWPGGVYPGASPTYEGTSILAGTKVMQRLGFFESYRWCFGIEDLILAVGHNGPAVLGLNWYEGMFNTDAKGFIHPTGRWAGGHGILTNRVNVREEWFWLPNSWSIWWGQGGGCKMSFTAMDRLLREDGEAVLAQKRKSKPRLH